MGVFNDLMGLLDMGERVVRGEGAEVKRELVDEVKRRATGTRASPRPGGCNKAPKGFRCLGTHDDRGQCMSLEQLDEKG